MLDASTVMMMVGMVVGIIIGLSVGTRRVAARLASMSGVADKDRFPPSPPTIKGGGKRSSSDCAPMTDLERRRFERAYRAFQRKKHGEVE